jgi:SAM-dependent methyltransferase
VSWHLFEQAATRYDAWFDTAHGQRVERAEHALLSDLLATFHGAETLLEVGCGTGRFSAWLAPLCRVLGIDRSPAMLAEMRGRHPMIPAVLGDAHRLPFRDASIDLVLFVTTLEFLEDPLAALREAVRVARRGLILLVLNRWSVGALSRRAGAQARGALLGQARDLSLPQLRAMAVEAAGVRLVSVSWASTLFPGGLWTARGRLPLGDVLGMAVVLAYPERESSLGFSRGTSIRAPARARGPRPCTAFQMRRGRGARWVDAARRRRSSGQHSSSPSASFSAPAPSRAEP